MLFSKVKVNKTNKTSRTRTKKHKNVIRVTSRHIVKAGEGVEIGHGLDDHGFGRGRWRRLGRVVQVWPLTISKVVEVLG